MIEKVSKSFKNFFKSPKDIISFFTPIVIAIILIIPTPYTVTVGGGVLDINKKIVVDNEYKSKGSIKSAYVKEMNGTVLTYILGKIIPSYELNKIEDMIIEDENKDEYDFREKLSFNTSIDTATLLAYKKAGKEIKIKNEDIYITLIDKDAKTTLKIKDIILKVEESDVKTMQDVSKLVNKYKYKDEINITVLRDKKKINTVTKLIDIDNEKKLGIYLSSNIEYDANPKIEFNFSNSEAGPSGGLMLTLAIYNKLVEEDITKGLKIVGTGTIDEDGNVGEIGGVKYKLKGAVKEKADLFIVPLANLEEVEKEIKSNNYNIKVLGVKTFDEVLEYLKK